jgi:MFS superfamily sulfate permease-like transporter
VLAIIIGIALVSFADTSVLSRTFAIRGGYRVNPNQELVALGAANAAAGLFQGFSVSSSSSRTPVAEAAGARTQLTGLVGALALLDFIGRAWRPYGAVLGRVDDLKGYHDVTRYPYARRIPGLVLFRWDAPLFFANAEVFAERVRSAIVSSPTRRGGWSWLAAKGVDLRFAEMKDPVKNRLKRYALYERFGDDRGSATTTSSQRSGSR